MSFDDQTQSYLEKGYALGRGYASSLRLNFQQHLFRELLGYLIHPSILSNHNLPENPKIADVGAGTAKWLIDVHRALPSAHLDGFDISKDWDPSDAWLPAQISLQELDIMKALPSSLENQYDMIHVPLFFGVVERDGVDTMLKQLYKMLRPGGYLQWVEYDPMSFKVISTDVSLKRAANEQYVDIIRGSQGITTKWPSHLPSHLKDAGFEQISLDSYPLPPELYAPFMQSHLCAAEEVSFTFMENDGPQARGPAFRKLLAEVYKECQTGVTMTECPVVVCGRKPTS